jgi:acyl carrier protein
MKGAAQRIAEFIAGRSPQSDEEFVRGCALPTQTFPQAAIIALLSRRAIARLGQIDPKYIYAEDTFRLLEVLPFWDSLDAVDIVMTLEDELGVQIADREAEHIRNPDLTRGLTVAEFVRDVFNVVKDKSIAPPTP